MDDTTSKANPDISREEMPAGINQEQQVWFVAAMYLGWAALIWLSQFTGLLEIDSRAAKILLLGACATNFLFIVLHRNHAINLPPADTMSLVQCIVGIVWATVFTFVSSGAGFVAIGLYVSIIVFAMFRVTQPVLNQIIVFGVIAYSMVNFSKLLISGDQSQASDYLVQMLIFAGIMASLASASRYVYQQQKRLEEQFQKMQQNLQREQTESCSRLFSRRYILDILTREKARTDRKNMPFSVCIFKADTLGPVSGDDPQHIFEGLADVIRATLREMDSVNQTEFHSGFDNGQDQKFLAVLPETNLSGARCCAERVLASVTAQLDENSDQIRLTCGLTQYHRGELINQLLERAEQALDQAGLSDVSTICDLTTESYRNETDRAKVVRFNAKRR